MAELLLAVPAGNSQWIPVTKKLPHLADISRGFGYILRKIVGNKEHDIDHCVVAQRIVNSMAVGPDPKVHSRFRDELSQIFIFDHVGVQYNAIS